GRAGRGELHDPELLAEAFVQVDVEADLVGVEGLGPIDVADGNRDQFKLHGHDGVILFSVREGTGRAKGVGRGRGPGGGSGKGCAGPPGPHPRTSCRPSRRRPPRSPCPSTWTWP